MDEEKEFYKICPTKGCRTISGFSLPKSDILKNEKYFCGECRKESILSKWKKSTKERMWSQAKNRKMIERFDINKNLSKIEMEKEVKKMLESEGFKDPKKRVIKEIIEEIER